MSEEVPNEEAAPQEEAAAPTEDEAINAGPVEEDQEGVGNEAASSPEVLEANADEAAAVEAPAVSEESAAVEETQQAVAEPEAEQPATEEPVIEGGEGGEVAVEEGAKDGEEEEGEYTGEPVKADGEVPETEKNDESDDDDDKSDKSDEDDDDDDDDEPPKGAKAPPTKDEQRKFLLNKLLKKCGKAAKQLGLEAKKLNWASATSDDAWDGVTFNAEGLISSLVLPDCKIAMKVDKDLKPLFGPALEVLDLSNNLLKGDFTKCVNEMELPKLRVLKLTGNRKLKGDPCAACVKSTGLEEFEVNLTGCTGQLSNLEGCLGLRVVNIGNTEVGGNVHSLKAMAGLTHVLCDYSQVTGDVEFAENLSELCSLYLNGKTITGDLTVFGNKCPNLTELWLTKTNVLGDLSFAQNCPNLVLLDLYGTQVGGDIESLSACTQLGALYLNYCFVVGDIKCLANCPNLAQILLDYTYITGDIEVFKGNEIVYEIGLAYTQSVGNLEAFHECSNLRFLNLYGIRGFDVPDYTQKPKPKKPEVLLKKVLRKVSRGKCRVTI